MAFFFNVLGQTVTSHDFIFFMVTFEQIEPGLKFQRHRVPLFETHGNYVPIYVFGLEMSMRKFNFGHVTLSNVVKRVQKHSS